MACVYCIYYDDKSDLYVGSTINFKRRFREHKSRIKNNYTEKKYCHMRKNINWKMRILEEFENISEDELYEHEKIYIQTLNPNLNDDHVNKEERKEKRKEYKRLYYQSDKAKQKLKEYRDANKEKINEKKKQYREANKEKINEKYTCECGCIVNKSTITRHRKTKKHLLMMSCS